jgi:hypothetical protein
LELRASPHSKHKRHHPENRSTSCLPRRCKPNEKIEAAEQEKKKLAEEPPTLQGRLATDDLADVSAESMVGHLARFGDYFDRFNAGQRKEMVGAVVEISPDGSLRNPRLRPV